MGIDLRASSVLEVVMDMVVEFKGADEKRSAREAFVGVVTH